MNEIWNYKWPVQNWATFEFDGIAYKDMSTYRRLNLEIRKWIYSVIDNPKKNVRFNTDRIIITVKFRKKEDATAFRLAFPEFNISG